MTKPLGSRPGKVGGKKAPKLRVIENMPPRCGDIVAMIRRFADELEAGEHGDVDHVVMVCAGTQIDVRGWGRMDGMTGIATLQLGATYLANSVLDQLDG
jgi:hypothetical protein